MLSTRRCKAHYLLDLISSTGARLKIPTRQAEPNTMKLLRSPLFFLICLTAVSCSRETPLSGTTDVKKIEIGSSTDLPDTGNAVMQPGTTPGPIAPGALRVSSFGQTITAPMNRGSQPERFWLWMNQNGLTSPMFFELQSITR